MGDNSKFFTYDESIHSKLQKLHHKINEFLSIQQTKEANLEFTREYIESLERELGSIDQIGVHNLNKGTTDYQTRAKINSKRDSLTASLKIVDNLVKEIEEITLAIELLRNCIQQLTQSDEHSQGFVLN